MNETALTADHLVILGRGRLLIDLPMQEFIHSRGTAAGPGPHRGTRSPAGRARRQGTVLLESAGGDGILTVDGASGRGVGAIAAQEGISILELTDEQMSLEQAYLDLTATRPNSPRHRQSPDSGPES